MLNDSTSSGVEWEKINTGKCLFCGLEHTVLINKSYLFGLGMGEDLIMTYYANGCSNRLIIALDTHTFESMGYSKGFHNDHMKKVMKNGEN